MSKPCWPCTNLPERGGLLTYQNFDESFPKTMQQTDIFISYSRKNLDFAQKLCETLSENHYAIWVEELIKLAEARLVSYNFHQLQ